LAAAGYTILNANELKTWMDARIADKKLSVVVMTQDVVPDTVAETQTSSCTIRKYLDAGGKVVWYADWPFYYQGKADGTMVTWGSAGASGVLGFNAATGPNDSMNVVTLTPEGITWGLTQTWQSQRPTSPTVAPNITVLAKDNAGGAAAWAKHFLPNDNFRGFVRFRDTGGQADAGDIMAAEYIGFKAGSPSRGRGGGSQRPLVELEAGRLCGLSRRLLRHDPRPDGRQSRVPPAVLHLVLSCRRFGAGRHALLAHRRDLGRRHGPHRRRLEFRRAGRQGLPPQPGR
jgi:hypothetical protein